MHNIHCPTAVLALFGLLALLAVQPDAVLAGEIPRPRGVAVSRAILYEPTGAERTQFVCLDGLKTIHFTQVNDDYCDCADASDEPGTAACPNGSFHCTNAGFKSLRLPSSRVNDGICDCCDASDEYSSTANCVNDCSERGKEDLLREKQKAEQARQGSHLKANMATQGQAKKTEASARLEELKRTYAEAESLVGEREKIKKEAESMESDAMEVYRVARDADRNLRIEMEAESSRKEAEETFKMFDSNADGILELAELQTRQTFDRNRDGQVSEDEALYFLDEQDQVHFETFLTLCWPRIKPFLMLDAGMFKPPVASEDAHDANSDPEQPVHEEHDDLNILDEGVEEGGEEEEEEFEEETGEGEVEQVETEEPNIEYDPDTQLLIEQANGARNLFLEADRELREIKTEITKIEQELEKDYGVDEEFATLHGECFNFEDREYVYKVCPFDRAVQQPKSGGAETRLGGWDRWGGSDEKNIYTTMVFANGAACWNGPQRSMHVKLECGLETKVLSVSEPNRCEYMATMQTPAACSVKESSTTSSTHDEL